MERSLRKKTYLPLPIFGGMRVSTRRVSGTWGEGVEGGREGGREGEREWGRVEVSGC